MKHWLFIYLYRHRPAATWQVANEVWKGDSIAVFFEEHWQQSDNGSSQEQRLLNAFEITKDEYDRLKDRLT